ncbi:RNA 2',3'-cyclic phosphodiesterase [Streptomyces uncialis]|uniref:RNA 2',3'-cyclic phosphodiesterase n=1 Tax=Streptomyces uncialis TaxID=1048205 RepID=A0A1Q4VDH1_9ACTN|nr:RNA 2',3'-cyclic phosphodiesterase [Streptomyces uncialis]OKH95864.1 2'-5' RNA ligase [Streptomyces uncialis]
MRLFAGVLPPPSVAAELGRAVDQLEDLPGASALKWTGRPGWHLTLAFYGEVRQEPADPVPELIRRLALAARRTPPFTLALRGAGVFGGRSLWADVAGDTGALARLSDGAQEAARGAGLPMGEHRRFRPHLSLARDRAGDFDFGPYVDAMAGFRGAEWEVGEVALVRSDLSGGGGGVGARARYEVVAALALGGGG